VSDFEISDVRAALTSSSVLDFYGWKFKRAGGELESTACPQRSDHSRRAFVINAKSGRWQCFPCATAGDLFDFIAAAERLSMPADFAQVLAKAAEIAGVGPSSMSDEERRRRAAAWKAERIEAEARERAAREAMESAAVPTATAYWGALAAKHPRGVEYLFDRGVGDVVGFADAVRFDPKHGGSPAVALFTRNGEIRNVVVRRVPELGEPKTPGLYQCPSAGTLINSVSQIEAGRDVYLAGLDHSRRARRRQPAQGGAGSRARGCAGWRADVRRSASRSARLRGRDDGVRSRDDSRAVDAQRHAEDRQAW
jgi:hypothetical protein